jgi:hypothetical protein
MAIWGAGLQSTYQLQQIHMHWGSRNKVGSEHTVDKMYYPLEVIVSNVLTASVFMLRDLSIDLTCDFY